MKSFIKKYEINAPINKVWACLTDSNLMNKWGAEPSSFTAKVGGLFTMWGDYLSGKVTDIVQNKLLVEDWTVDGMTEPSVVTFILELDNNNTTIIQLKHKNIPEALADELFQGWDDHYLGAIKKYLEK